MQPRNAYNMPVSNWEPVFQWRWDLVLVLALAGLCWPFLFEHGLIVQCDYPCWASIINMYGKEVIPASRWFWGMPLIRENAGEILGQPYSLSIILPWLLTKLVPLAVAIKLTIIITYFAIAFGLYFLVRPKCCRLVAAMVAYLCVLENLTTINYGMWYNSLSIGLAFWFWAALCRYAKTNRRRDWAGALILLVLTILAHPLGTIAALSGWIGHFLQRLWGAPDRNWRKVLSSGSLAVVALMIAFPQIRATLSGSIIPFGEGWGPMRYHLFGALGTSLGRLLFPCAVVGCVVLVIRQRPLAILLVPALLVCHAIYLRKPLLWIPFDFPLKGGLLAFSSRFELVISSIALIPLAVGLCQALITPNTKESPHRLIVRNVAEIVLMVLLLGTLACGAEHTLITQPRFLVTEQGLADCEDVQGLCEWIAEEVDHRSERIYVEDMMGCMNVPVRPTHALSRRLAAIAPRLVPDQWIPTTCTTHYLALLSLRTPAEQVNGFPVYRNAFSRQYCGHSDNLFGLKPEGLPQEKMKEQLWRLACRHVVAHTPQVCRLLDKMKFLKPVAAFGRYRVFTWTEMVPHVSWWEGPTRDIVPTQRPGYLEYRLDIRDRKSEAVLVSLQYHPNWKAQLDGHDLAVTSWNSLMRIVLPPNRTGTLILQYEAGQASALPLVCLGLAAAFLLLIFAHRPANAQVAAP